MNHSKLLYIKTRVLLLLFSLLAITSCAAVTEVEEEEKAAEGILKKAKTVFTNLKTITKPKGGFTSSLNMMVYANDEVNINALEEPTPVNFLVIQMKSDLKLYESTFDELAAGIKDALKDDYVAHKEYKALPGKFVDIKIKKLKKKTKHIAVVAAYKELDQVIWRTSHKVKSIGENYVAHVAMKKAGIKMEVKASE